MERAGTFAAIWMCLLAFCACGDTPETPTGEPADVVARPVPEPAPAEPARDAPAEPEPEPEASEPAAEDGEPWTPPSNWCGTGHMDGVPRPMRTELKLLMAR